MELDLAEFVKLLQEGFPLAHRDRVHVGGVAELFVVLLVTILTPGLEGDLVMHTSNGGVEEMHVGGLSAGTFILLQRMSLLMGLRSS